MSKIVDNLIRKQQYAELIDFIEPYLPLIDRATRRALCLQKLHDNIKSMKGTNLREVLHYILKKKHFGG